MKRVALAVALASSLALVAGCSRTDHSYSSTTNAAPPVTPSTGAMSSAAPPLPATPTEPSGAGQPSNTSSAAPTGTPSSGSSASSSSSDTAAPTTGTSSDTAAPSSGAKDANAADTPANNPTGSMTKEQESSGMPKAGQANNHSSPAMEESRGQAR